MPFTAKHKEHCHVALSGAGQQTYATSEEAALGSENKRLQGRI